MFGGAGHLSPNSWTLWFDQERWWDQITARHGDGTDFGLCGWTRRVLEVERSSNPGSGQMGLRSMAEQRLSGQPVHPGPARGSKRGLDETGLHAVPELRDGSSARPPLRLAARSGRIAMPGPPQAGRSAGHDRLPVSRGQSHVRLYAGTGLDRELRLSPLLPERVGMGIMKSQDAGCGAGRRQGNSARSSRDFGVGRAEGIRVNVVCRKGFGV